MIKHAYVLVYYKLKNKLALFMLRGYFSTSNKEVMD